MASEWNGAKVEKDSAKEEKFDKNKRPHTHTGQVKVNLPKSQSLDQMFFGIFLFDCVACVINFYSHQVKHTHTHVQRKISN